MDDTWVLLLRSLNVGGRNRLPMADLRSTIEGLGFGEVSTYVQSGNVILDGGGRNPAEIAAKVEEALASDRGIETVVILRRGAELATALDRHPFRDDVEGDDGRATALHVAFCREAPSAQLSAADLERVHPDRAAVAGTEVFLHYPDGMARTKLTGALLERRLGVALTARNWRTVTELVSRST